MKRKTRTILYILTASSLLAVSCGPGESGESPEGTGKGAADSGVVFNVGADTRIVSLNGTISEILVELGLEKNIVGTDVTSTYPASLEKVPKVGHNRDISAEGVLSLRPDLILARAEELDPGLRSQFEQAGARVIAYEHSYSPQGSKTLISEVSASLGLEAGAQAILAALENDLDSAKQYIDTLSRPGVLFIYARGTGTMMVAGEDTEVASMIQLAGGENAVKGFKNYKPLTAESLVAANPDVILLFDSGLESLGGMEGLLKVQGIAQTNAGKNSKILEMDGQYLTGFGPRLGKALAELAQGIR